MVWWIGGMEGSVEVSKQCLLEDLQAVQVSGLGLLHRAIQGSMLKDCDFVKIRELRSGCQAGSEVGMRVAEGW